MSPGQFLIVIFYFSSLAVAEMDEKKLTSNSVEVPVGCVAVSSSGETLHRARVFFGATMLKCEQRLCYSQDGVLGHAFAELQASAGAELPTIGAGQVYLTPLNLGVVNCTSDKELTSSYLLSLTTDRFEPTYELMRFHSTVVLERLWEDYACNGILQKTRCPVNWVVTCTPEAGLLCLPCPLGTGHALPTDLVSAAAANEIIVMTGDWQTKCDVPLTNSRMASVSSAMASWGTISSAAALTNVKSKYCYSHASSLGGGALELDSSWLSDKNLRVCPDGTRTKAGFWRVKTGGEIEGAEPDHAQFNCYDVTDVFSGSDTIEERAHCLTVGANWFGVYKSQHEFVDHEEFCHEHFHMDDVQYMADDDQTVSYMKVCLNRTVTLAEDAVQCRIKTRQCVAKIDYDYQYFSASIALDPVALEVGFGDLSCSAVFYHADEVSVVCNAPRLERVLVMMGSLPSVTVEGTDCTKFDGQFACPLPDDAQAYTGRVKLLVTANGESVWVTTTKQDGEVSGVEPYLAFYHGTDYIRDHWEVFLIRAACVMGLFLVVWTVQTFLFQSWIERYLNIKVMEKQLGRGLTSISRPYIPTATIVLIIVVVFLIPAIRADKAMNCAGEASLRTCTLFEYTKVDLPNIGHTETFLLTDGEETVGTMALTLVDFSLRATGRPYYTSTFNWETKSQSQCAKHHGVHHSSDYRDHWYCFTDRLAQNIPEMRNDYGGDPCHGIEHGRNAINACNRHGGGQTFCLCDCHRVKHPGIGKRCHKHGARCELERACMVHNSDLVQAEVINPVNPHIDATIEVVFTTHDNITKCTWNTHTGADCGVVGSLTFSGLEDAIELAGIADRSMVRLHTKHDELDVLTVAAAHYLPKEGEVGHVQWDERADMRTLANNANAAVSWSFTGTRSYKTDPLLTVAHLALQERNQTDRRVLLPFHTGGWEHSREANELVARPLGRLGFVATFVTNYTTTHVVKETCLDKLKLEFLGLTGYVGSPGFEVKLEIKTPLGCQEAEVGVSISEHTLVNKTLRVLPGVQEYALRGYSDEDVLIENIKLTSLGPHQRSVEVGVHGTLMDNIKYNKTAGLLQNSYFDERPKTKRFFDGMKGEGAYLGKGLKGVKAWVPTLRSFDTDFGIVVRYVLIALGAILILWLSAKTGLLNLLSVSAKRVMVTQAKKRRERKTKQQQLSSIAVPKQVNGLQRRGKSKDQKPAPSEGKGSKKSTEPKKVEKKKK